MAIDAIRSDAPSAWLVLLLLLLFWIFMYKMAEITDNKFCKVVDVLGIAVVIACTIIKFVRLI